MVVAGHRAFLQAVQLPDAALAPERVAAEGHTLAIDLDQVTQRAIGMAWGGKHANPCRAEGELFPILVRGIHADRLGQHQVVRVLVVDVPAVLEIVPVRGDIFEIGPFGGRDLDPCPPLGQGMHPAGLVAVVVGEHHALGALDARLAERFQQAGFATVHKQGLIPVPHHAHLDRPPINPKVLAQPDQRAGRAAGAGPCVLASQRGRYLAQPSRRCHRQTGGAISHCLQKMAAAG